MAILILVIIGLGFFMKSNSRWDVKLVSGDFKRVKVGWLLSHIYVDINYNKVKDGKLCLRGLIYQIVNDFMIVLLIVGLIVIYLKTGKYEQIVYYSLVMMGLSVISDLCFIMPMRIKTKRLYREMLQQNIKKNEEERRRKAEESKQREENAFRESVPEESAPTEAKEDNSEN